jgi:Caspase domain
MEHPTLCSVLDLFRCRIVVFACHKRCNITYPYWHAGTSATLRGCINDVKSMYALLTECYGFPQQNISVLVDDGSSQQAPTGANIKKYLSGLVSASQPGDIAVFHFSGHGTQVFPASAASFITKLGLNPHPRKLYSASSMAGNAMK